MTMTTEPAAPVRSVRRALAILRAFRLSDRSLALGEIARRARLDKATARRLLMTLMAERLVEQDADTKGYSLGLGVLELAAGLTPCDDLRQRAQPLLAAIAEDTGATAFLGVVHDGAALCIGRVDGDEAIQIRAWSVGGRMPLNCGAGPRVLMAYRWLVLLCIVDPATRPPFVEIMRIFFVSSAASAVFASRLLPVNCTSIAAGRPKFRICVTMSAGWKKNSTPGKRFGSSRRSSVTNFAVGSWPSFSDNWISPSSVPIVPALLYDRLMPEFGTPRLSSTVPSCSGGTSWRIAASRNS